MLSRVANSVYWMCRNIERAENIARFIGVNLNLLLDMPSETGGKWEPLVLVTGDQDLFEDPGAEPVLRGEGQGGRLRVSGGQDLEQVPLHSLVNRPVAPFPGFDQQAPEEDEQEERRRHQEEVDEAIEDDGREHDRTCS